MPYAAKARKAFAAVYQAARLFERSGELSRTQLATIEAGDILGSSVFAQAV